MTEIRPLYDLSTDELYAGFAEAFADYKYKWSKEDFERMLQRRGFAPELSFGAFDDDKLISFTLNCVGRFNGHKTAYDTATGTIKAFRGRGLASQIFNHSIPFLKKRDITHYLLEVLQENETAISVYTKASFKESRSFTHYLQNSRDVVFAKHGLPEGCSLRFTYLNDRHNMEALWDVQPAWQNSFDALTRQPGGFFIWGVYDGAQLIGYGIIETATGDIPQLAVHKDYRRKGIGSAILKELLKYNEANRVKIINVDTKCTAMTPFLAHHNIPLEGMQTEMIRPL